MKFFSKRCCQYNKLQFRRTFPCVFIGSVLAGCIGCSSTVQNGTALTATTTTSGTIDPAHTAPSSQTPAGTVATEVFIPVLNPQTRVQATTRAPNDLQIRVVSQDEVVAVPTSGYVAFARPDTREVAYLAFTCGNASCQAQAKAGRPFLFPQPYKNVKLNAAGEIDWAPLSVFEGPGPASEGMPACPLCQSNNHVKVFVLPEIEPRLARLNSELQESRKVLREVRRTNAPFPKGMRPPVAIMQEIGSLPQLFITRPVQSDGTNNSPGQP